MKNCLFCTDNTPQTLMGQAIDALNNQTQTNFDDLNLNLDGGLDCNVDEVNILINHVFGGSKFHLFGLILGD